MNRCSLLFLSGTFYLTARYVYKSKRILFKSLVFMTYIWSGIHFHNLGMHLGILLSLKKSAELFY